jgi:hypothetical protein
VKPLLLMVAALFLASCGQHGGGNRVALTVKQTDIVAPPGEKTFTEKYGLKITVPSRNLIRAGFECTMMKSTEDGI